MSIFEFVMVLVSIIIGLGIAEILTGIAGQIRWRKESKPYLLHSLIVVAIFLALIQQWWEIWGLSGETRWTFVALMLMLGGPVCLHLIAHLLFPDDIRQTTMRDYYYGEMRPVWLLICGAVVIGTLFRPLAFGEDLLHPDNATSILALTGCLVLAFTTRPAVHAVVGPLLLISLVYDIFRFSFLMAEG